MGITERKEREKRQRRTDIMEAAKKVFFAKGLMSATMDEIANVAELSKGTLYLYFQSKEELYLSLLGEGDLILKTMLQKELSQSLAAEELIRRIATTYYQFYNKYPDYFKIMFFFYHGDLSEKISKELFDKNICQATDTLKMIEGAIQKGVDDGTFKAVDTWKTTLNLWATANGIFFLYTAKEHEYFMGGFNEKILLDHAIEIILYGLKK